MIHLGDSREVLKKVSDKSVQLIITSPPYKDEDGFSIQLMRDVFQECHRVLDDNTLFFLNFGHLATDKFRPFQVCEEAMNTGFKLNDTIVWIKNHYKPIQGERRLNNLTEFIFLLYKGKMPKLNRLAVGVPYKDKSNAARYNKGQNLRCAGNIWNINYPTITKASQKPHNDRFPPELPERCIKLCGYPLKVVLDPFCGSGTVCKAAKDMGLEYVGIDKDKTHFLNAVALVGE